MADTHKLRTCSKCTFSTHKQSTFSMHMLMKHSNKKPHKCTLCSATFSVKTQLQHHMINKHTKNVIKCQHHQCNMTFKHNTAEMVHYMKRHVKHEDYFETFGNENLTRCLHCHNTFTKAAIYYHIGKCNPQSPFHPNNAFLETYCTEWIEPPPPPPPYPEQEQDPFNLNAALENLLDDFDEFIPHYFDENVEPNIQSNVHNVCRINNFEL